MTIYTRSGDSGETSLGDGSRIAKDSARVEAYGTIDETNALIGLARVGVTDDLLGGFLLFAQQKLSNCASCVAVPGSDQAGLRVTSEDVATLERYADRFAENTGPLTGFVLPAGSITASRLQVARTVARRAERRLVALASDTGVESEVLAFANRLSDALFAAARYANQLDGVPEEPWDQQATTRDF